MIKNRWAEVGDLIFHTTGGVRHAGVVYAVLHNRYNHGTVFINWVTEPSQYNPRAGYSSVNIHNLRREFELIKK